MAVEIVEVGGEVLREARKARKPSLSVEAAAHLLGITERTLRRWESSGRLKLRELENVERVYGVSLRPKRPDKGVPRGTSVREPGIPTTAARQIRDFEIEAARAGATDEELDHIHASLTSQSSRSFYLGGNGEEELEHLIEGLRVWLQRRIDKRRHDEPQKR